MAGSTSDKWRTLVHDGQKPDGRAHLLRGQYPACGTATTPQGFLGAWAEKEKYGTHRCKKCSRLAK